MIDNLNALPLGTELNHYVIEAVLGSGGFGIVYKAHHAHLDEQVVIKEFLPVELAGRHGNTVAPHGTSKQGVYNECLRRFMEEGRTLVKLRHPNVVRCRDLFTANGTAYLVMDFEDGLPLDELVRSLEAQGSRYTEQQLLHFLKPLADGLAYIHSQGVLHRDIKPANVFIRRTDGSPVIIDFGAAKQNFALASQSQAPFTEFYAPLEQIEGGGEAKPTVDIHAFGALMFRVVTGQIGPKAEARAMALVYGKPDPLQPAAVLAQGQYSQPFLATIDQCLAFKADERPQTMAEVKRLLIQLAFESVSAEALEKTPIHNSNKVTPATAKGEPENQKGHSGLNQSCSLLSEGAPDVEQEKVSAVIDVEETFTQKHSGKPKTSTSLSAPQKPERKNGNNIAVVVAIALLVMISLPSIYYYAIYKPGEKAAFIASAGNRNILDLANDSEALSIGESLFQKNCASCHGIDARGAPGFSNLTDSDWQYGGSPENIRASILYGRRGQMPGWYDVLGEQGIKEMTQYVLSLSGRYVNESEAEAGKAAFSACVACHGYDGKGSLAHNIPFGAPDLTDNIWLYGGSESVVNETLRNGRNGQMPAFKQTLGEDKVQVLTAYVYSLSRVLYE